MKLAKRLVFALLLTASTSSLYAGCLNLYNQDLYACDQYACSNGPFTCGGCYTDAVGRYWGCVGHNILN